MNTLEYRLLDYLSLVLMILLVVVIVIVFSLLVVPGLNQPYLYHVLVVTATPAGSLR